MCLVHKYRSRLLQHIIQYLIGKKVHQYVFKGNSSRQITKLDLIAGMSKQTPVNPGLKKKGQASVYPIRLTHTLKAKVTGDELYEHLFEFKQIAINLIIHIWVVLLLA